MALPNPENFRYIPLMTFDHGKSICHTKTKIKGGPNARLDAFQSHWISVGGAASFVLIRDLVDDPLARRFAEPSARQLHCCWVRFRGIPKCSFPITIVMLTRR